VVQSDPARFGNPWNGEGSTLFSLAVRIRSPELASCSSDMKLNSSKAFAMILGALLASGIALIFVTSRVEPGQRTDRGDKAVSDVAETDETARTFIPGGDAAPPAVTMPSASTVDPARWEARIEELLANPDINTSEAIRELFAMAGDGRGPEALRIDAVEHGLNLLEDEDYFRDAIALATNPGLPEEINDILFADLHNRAPSISAAVAERIAKTPGHPLAQDAKDFVDFFEDDPDAESPAAPPATAADPKPAE
jgi:hypothetical protein